MDVLSRTGTMSRGNFTCAPLPYLVSMLLWRAGRKRKLAHRIGASSCRSWAYVRVIVPGFGDGQVMGGLEIEPESRVGSEIASEPDRGIGGDIALAAHDLAGTPSALASARALM